MTIKKRTCGKCNSTNIVYPPGFIFEDKLFTYYKCEDCNMNFVTNIQKYELMQSASLVINQPSVSKEINK